MIRFWIWGLHSPKKIGGSCLTSDLYDLSVDTLGFSVFLHASPVDFFTADTTVWHQSKIQGRNDPFFFFTLLNRNMDRVSQGTIQ